MPKEKKTVQCKFCGDHIKLNGIGPHQKLCLRNIRKAGQDLEFVEMLRKGVFFYTHLLTSC